MSSRRTTLNSYNTIETSGGNTTLSFVIPRACGFFLVLTLTVKLNCHPACPGVPWDRSEVEGPAALSTPLSNPKWKHHPLLCHPERSRGICSLTPPATKAEGTSTLHLKQNCHPDRGVPKSPTSRHSRLPRKRLSVQKGAQSLPTPPSSTGNLGVRSGEIRGSHLTCPGDDSSHSAAFSIRVFCTGLVNILSPWPIFI